MLRNVVELSTPTRHTPSTRESRRTQLHAPNSPQQLQTPQHQRTAEREHSPSRRTLQGPPTAEDDARAKRPALVTHALQATTAAHTAEAKATPPRDYTQRPVPHTHAMYMLLSMLRSEEKGDASHRCPRAGEGANPSRQGVSGCLTKSKVKSKETHRYCVRPTGIAHRGHPALPHS